MSIPRFAIIPTIALSIAAFTGFNLAIYLLLAVGAVIAYAEFQLALREIKQEEAAQELLLASDDYRRGYEASREQSLGG